MYDYFDRDQETQESKNLDRPQEMTEAEQEALDNRHEAAKKHRETLNAARADMIENEEKGYLRQTQYDSDYETTRDEEIGR